MVSFGHVDLRSDIKPVLFCDRAPKLDRRTGNRHKDSIYLARALCALEQPCKLAAYPFPHPESELSLFTQQVLEVPYSCKTPRRILEEYMSRLLSICCGQ